MNRGVRLTRRSMLAASAAFVAACSGKKKPTAKPTPPADEAAMTNAYRQEAALIAAYDRALATATTTARADLEVERAVHATHLAALHAFRPPPLAAGTTSLEVSPKHLKRTMQQYATSGQLAAVNATDGDNAALLSSIAASHTISAAAPSKSAEPA